MSPREYRSIVTIIQGGKPPCIKCDDSDVAFCMNTGSECQKFTNYSAVPMPKRSRLACPKSRGDPPEG